MDTPMPSGKQNEVEVIIGVQRRKRWTPEQKLEWVKKTMEPGISVSLEPGTCQDFCVRGRFS